MPAFCPNCGVSLRPDANFCTECGHRIVQPEPVISLEPEMPQAKVPVEPVALEAPDPLPIAEDQGETSPEPPALSLDGAGEMAQEPPRKKMHGCLKWFLIALCLGLIGVLVLVGALWFIGRPRLQSFTINTVEDVLDEQLGDNITPYNGRYFVEDITERTVNDYIEEYLDMDQVVIPAPFDRYISTLEADDLQIRFEKDQIQVTLKTNGVTGSFSAEVDADRKGYIEIENVEVSGLFWLTLDEDTLDETLTEFANEYYFDPRNLFIHAIDIEDGVIHLEYEPRD